MGQSPAQSGFFGAIVRMAHMLGLKVVAEGIETDLQWHYLRSLDADAAQGYWLPRLLEADAIEGWTEGPAVQPGATGEGPVGPEAESNAASPSPTPRAVNGGSASVG